MERFQPMTSRPPSAAGEPVADHREDMRRIAREFGFDEAKLIRPGDIGKPWNTLNGKPIGSAPRAATPLPAWYPGR